jgi:hypothetical protein
MARVRSTARVTREGQEAEIIETTPISEVMKQSDLVVAGEGTSAAEAKQTFVEEEDVEEDEEDYSILIPTKPSHLDFGKSTVFEADMPMMVKLGYLGWLKRNLSDLPEKKPP